MKGIVLTASVTRVVQMIFMARIFCRLPSFLSWATGSPGPGLLRTLRMDRLQRSWRTRAGKRNAPEVVARRVTCDVVYTLHNPQTATTHTGQQGTNEPPEWTDSSLHFFMLELCISFCVCAGLQITTSQTAARHKLRYWICLYLETTKGEHTVGTLSPLVPNNRTCSAPTLCSAGCVSGVDVQGRQPSSNMLENQDDGRLRRCC